MSLSSSTWRTEVRLAMPRPRVTLFGTGRGGECAAGLCLIHILSESYPLWPLYMHGPRSPLTGWFDNVKAPVSLPLNHTMRTVMTPYFVSVRSFCSFRFLFWPDSAFCYVLPMDRFFAFRRSSSICPVCLVVGVLG